MKVLLISSSFLVPWMQYTARALQRLNHQVVPFLCSNPMLDRLTLRRGRGWLRRLAGDDSLADRLREQWMDRRDKRLLALAQRSRPNLILILRGETLSCRTLQALKAAAGSPPLITWWLDDPFRFPIRDRLAAFDRFYVFDRSYIQELRTGGANAVEFLPCACDETVYRPLTVSPTQQRRLRSEVAFVAWYGPGRDRMVHALQEFDLKVWGRGWSSPEAQSALRGVRHRIVAAERYVPDRTTAQIYNVARIGLNVHNAQTRQAGLNARAFELLSCGTFELTDHVPGMEDLLEPDQEVATYTCAEEARQKVSYYLRHPEEARQITQRGHQRVLGEHTYLHRMRTLLKAWTT